MTTATEPQFRVTKRDLVQWKLASGFDTFHWINGVIRIVTLGRWWPLVGPMDGKAWRFYLWLASGAWPYSEWRAGRIP